MNRLQKVVPLLVCGLLCASLIKAQENPVEEVTKNKRETEKGLELIIFFCLACGCQSPYIG